MHKPPVTTQAPHSHSELIDAVGRDVVVSTFGLSPQALHMWRRRGIPQMKRHAFAKLAADHCKAVPADFFEPFELPERAA